MSNDIQWPADRVERWPLDKLIPYARNARLHSDAQVAQIAASIREWGWTIPVLVAEDGTIIAGHGRVLAARQLGLDTVPVTIARGWTDAQRRAYTIADNKLALSANWDFETLRLELGELDLEFDVGLTGFDMGEIDLALGEGDQGKGDGDGGTERQPGGGDPVIQYNIIFDTVEEQETWYRFVRHLKTLYPSEATLSARLVQYIADQGV